MRPAHTLTPTGHWTPGMCSQHDNTRQHLDSQLFLHINKMRWVKKKDIICWFLMDMAWEILIYIGTALSGFWIMSHIKWCEFEGVFYCTGSIVEFTECNPIWLSPLSLCRHDPYRWIPVNPLLVVYIWVLLCDIVAYHQIVMHHSYSSAKQLTMFWRERNRS